MHDVWFLLYLTFKSIWRKSIVDKNVSARVRNIYIDIIDANAAANIPGLVSSD